MKHSYGERSICRRCGTEFTDDELSDLYFALRNQISIELKLRPNDRAPAVKRFERLRIKVGLAQARGES